MIRRGFGVMSVGLVVAFGYLACKSPPPRVVTASSAAPEPPPPPPPPKCDSLEEGCVATESTRAPIGGSTWSIAPPPKWTYAHEADAMVARTEASALAAVVVATGDKKTADANRDAAFATLVQKLAVTMPAKKVVWPSKPAKTMTVGGVKVALYQFDKVKRDGKPVAMLVFTSKLPNAQSIFGAGFVLESDTNDSDKAILKSIESLASDGSSGGAAGDAGADGGHGPGKDAGR